MQCAAGFDSVIPTPMNEIRQMFNIQDDAPVCSFCIKESEYNAFV